jgi:DNA mismatch repair protein MutS
MRLLNLFKKKYPGCILFFRIGENYEAFCEDAEVCSKILNIPLTIRNKSNRFIPFISILSHAVEDCLQKMVMANYKIAIFEQVETRNCMMDVTRRDIVRVVVPNLI